MMLDKRKIFTILKCLSVLVILLIVVAVTIVKYENNNEQQKEQQVIENIHADILEVFSKENIKVTDKDDVPKDVIWDGFYSGLNKVSTFEYGDIKYYSFDHIMDEELIDTSVVLLEVERYDDKTTKGKVYKLKDAATNYMLTVECDGVYYLYGAVPLEHKTLKEYIDIIGTKEKLNIEYIKATLKDGEDEQVQYIFGPETEKWLWNFLLNNEHKYIGVAPSSITSGSEWYPEKHIEFNVCIVNEATNIPYDIFILPNGNVAISDRANQFHYFEYEIDSEELLDALQTLVDVYEAHVVTCSS